MININQTNKYQTQNFKPKLQQHYYYTIDSYIDILYCKLSCYANKNIFLFGKIDKKLKCILILLSQLIDFSVPFVPLFCLCLLSPDTNY